MKNQQINLYFVLGGAVSAGAYTAGVFDFFIEKLKAYMQLDSKSRNFDIKIKAIAGASAGGMCGAIITNGIASGWQIDRNEDSPLYQAWVKKIDIKKLVTLDDLQNKKVKSLLNGNALKHIADEVLKVPNHDIIKLPNFVSKDYQLILSVTNTNGLSYALDFVNKNLENPYFITNHRDYFNFSFNKTSNNKTVVLKNKADWEYLKKAAIATGAFPIGLPPVQIQRPISIYQNNQYKGLTAFNLGGETIDYYAIDGGTVDNEPLIKIIELLEKEKDEDSKQIIIFIDPFPSERNIPKGNSIKDNLSRLYTVFRNQSSFKPKELSYFIDKLNSSKSDTVSTFFIAPKRRDKKINELHVAGGAFNAFGGFLDEKFREHDYILGKRNCQKFLSNQLPLINNKLLFEEKNIEQKINLPPWPKISDSDFKPIGKSINKRMHKVTKLLVGKWYLNLFINLINFSKYIKKDLNKNGLLN